MRVIGHNELLLAARAIAEATGEKEFVVVGTGALGCIDEIPDSMLRTDDVDMFPRKQTRFDMEQVDSEIGEGSEFERKHGFYVQRVGDWTVMDQPQGWQERATTIQDGELTLICLSPIDLAYNKLNAGREKDITFVGSLLKHHIVDPTELEAFIRAGAPPYHVDTLVSRLHAYASDTRAASPLNQLLSELPQPRQQPPDSSTGLSL